MVLPPTLTARHVALWIPCHLQMPKPHQTLTRPLHLHLSWRITRILFDKAKDRSLLQMHFKMATQWQSTFPWSWHLMLIKGLLYKCIMDSHQKFLALVIPKCWHFTVLVETHDKLGHQGINRTYRLVKQQYYWKGMNKDICKYIDNCSLHQRKNAGPHAYPLQVTDIPDRPFDK